MSLRLQICGFDLAKLRSLFGSGDARVIDFVQAEFEKWGIANPTSVNADYRKIFHASLQQAIHHGIPFPGLIEEEAPHVQLAMMLASYEQPLFGADSNYWNHRSVVPTDDPDENDIGGKLAVQFASDLAKWCDEILAANRDFWCYRM